MASKKRKLWMLPTSAAMMIGGLVCIASMLISMQFSMPEKPQISAASSPRCVIFSKIHAMSL